MTLPLVIIFNRHWESTPFSLTNHLIPELTKEGYNTFCLEIPDTLSEDNVIELSKSAVKDCIELTNLFNSHANKTKLSFPKNLEMCTFEEIHEACPSLPQELLIGLKSLSANKLYLENLQLAKKWAFSIIGLDDANALNELTSTPSSSPQYMAILQKTSMMREEILANRLFNLHTEKKGVIIQLGYKHFKPVLESLKKKGLQSEDIVCHFAHSSYRAFRTMDEIKSLHQKGEVEREKTSCATTDKEIQLLNKKIMNEVKVKIKNKNLDNPHTPLLDKFFKVKFKPSLRPEYYLDACLDIKKRT